MPAYATGNLCVNVKHYLAILGDLALRPRWAEYTDSGS